MKIIIKLIILIILMILLINIYIISITKTKIYPKNNLPKEEYDCILVLGAGIRKNKPSPMLEDRLLTAIELYNANLSSKILVSGDHSKTDYDEVNVMKNYLKEKLIPSEDIFMDHAGISSYDSIYRAKEIFKCNNMIIVTQKYHLYRSLYISDKLGIKAYGTSADKRKYTFQLKREIREIAARIKDFFKCILKPTSKYLGDPIPIQGNGDITNN